MCRELTVGWSDATTTDSRGIFHGFENRVGATRCERDVKRVGFGVIRHCPQILKSTRAWAVIDRNVELWNTFAAKDSLTVFVDVDDVLISKIPRV